MLFIFIFYIHMYCGTMIWLYYFVFLNFLWGKCFPNDRFFHNFENDSKNDDRTCCSAWFFKSTADILLLWSRHEGIIALPKTTRIWMEVKNILNSTKQVAGYTIPSGFSCHFHCFKMFRTVGWFRTLLVFRCRQPTVKLLSADTNILPDSREGLNRLRRCRGMHRF